MAAADNAEAMETCFEVKDPLDKLAKLDLEVDDKGAPISEPLRKRLERLAVARHGDDIQSTIAHAGSSSS